MNEKPRIRLSRNVEKDGRAWLAYVCRGGGLAGFGSSVESAYYIWQLKMKTKDRDRLFSHFVAQGDSNEEAMTRANFTVLGRGWE